jgi:hypothetical protein
MTPQERALAKYGNLHQLHKYAEECAEAAAAVIRWLVDPTPEHSAQMMEEIADVEICTLYPRLVFGDEDIDASRAAKLARLEETLAASKNTIRFSDGY